MENIRVLLRTNDDGFLLGLKLAWMRAPTEHRVSQIKCWSSPGEIQSRRDVHRMLPAWVQAMQRRRWQTRILCPCWIPADDSANTGLSALLFRWQDLSSDGKVIQEMWAR